MMDNNTNEMQQASMNAEHMNTGDIASSSMPSTSHGLGYRSLTPNSGQNPDPSQRQQVIFTETTYVCYAEYQITFAHSSYLNRKICSMVIYMGENYNQSIKYWPYWNMPFVARNNNAIIVA